MAATERSYPFKWGLQLYRTPPKMKPEDYKVPDYEIDRFDELIMDKAKKRLRMEK